MAAVLLFVSLKFKCSRVLSSALIKAPKDQPVASAVDMS